MRIEDSELATEAAPEARGAIAVGDGPTVVLRRHAWIRFTGLGLLAAGIALGVIGPPVAFVGAALGLLVCTSWISRMQVGAEELRIRRLHGSKRMAIADIDEVRLRRVPIGRPRPVHRSYRIGRFCTTPLRLWVMQRDEPVIQVAVVGWADWPVLVRYLLSLPTVSSDSRTRGRLDRYG